MHSGHGDHAAMHKGTQGKDTADTVTEQLCGRADRANRANKIPKTFS